MTTSTKPLISVVIPFFNRVEWTFQAVNSVLKQTYQNFEIILIDDGSTEPLDLLESISDARINIIHQKNQGTANARNAGISQASGEYIAFLDSDDLFLPDKLEKQVIALENDLEALLCHSSYSQIDTNGNFIKFLDYGSFSGYQYPSIIYNCPIATPTVLARKCILDQVEGFPKGVNIGEDTILWIKVAKHGKIIGLRDNTTLVRIHGTNTISSNEKICIGLLNVLEYSVFKDNDLNWKDKRKIAGEYYYNIANLQKQGDFSKILYYRLKSLVFDKSHVLRYFRNWVRYKFMPDNNKK